MMLPMTVIQMIKAHRPSDRTAQPVGSRARLSGTYLAAAALVLRGEQL